MDTLDTKTGLFDNVFRRAIQPVESDLPEEEAAWVQRVKLLPEGQKMTIGMLCCSQMNLEDNSCPVHGPEPGEPTIELFKAHGLENAARKLRFIDDANDKIRTVMG